MNSKKKAPKIVIGNFDELVNEWKIIYAQADELDEKIDRGVCMESLCVGWCMAKGLPIAAALHFYQSMIPLNLF